MQTKKVVQTEIDLATYARLKRLAEKRSLPLKTVLREAVVTYVDREEGAMEKDPIFQLVGSLGLEDRNRSERKDWRP